MIVARLLSAVFAAVLLVACGSGEAVEPTPEAMATVGAGEPIEVVGTDDLKYSKTLVTAPAGELTFALTCEDAVAHDIVIEHENADDETVVVCEAGETATGSTTLEAGDYVFYCSVPGHRSAGMEGRLNVVAAS